MSLHLPTVTLLCADTRTPELAAYALKRCGERVSFGNMVFLGEAGAFDSALFPPPIECVPISRMGSIVDYSRLMFHGLRGLVQTSHLLVVQWDGFITSPDLWRPEFLAYDYIGPPWYHGGHPGFVGNGGFSLRSCRLLDALTAFEFDPAVPEDTAICVTYRKRLESEMGIRFAPLEVAQQFGCEYGKYRPSFGFHGMHNFAHVMPHDELMRWLATAPSDILASQHARKLVKELIATGNHQLASILIKLRARTLGWSFDQQMLALRNLGRGLTSKRRSPAMKPPGSNGIGDAG